MLKRGAREMTDKLLTLNDLSEYLNISRRTVYRLLEGTQLPAYRIGGHLRFKRNDVDEWLEHQKLVDKKTG